MSIFHIILIIVAILVVGGLLFNFFFCRYVAKRVYNDMLVRTSPEKWGRACSAPEVPEHLEMWNKGVEWAEARKDKITEVEIENEGFHLFGEYFDFGHKKAVIIIPGRSESLMYSYYFAIPYEKAGCNVLVIDIRAHGKSDGIYDSVCVGEDEDILKWSQLLHDRFGNEKIILHGICIGACACTMLAVREDFPDYICAVISEGGYTSFPETFKQHMIQINKPVFPVMQMVMHELKVHTGTDVYKTAPIDFIDKTKVPYLFICGKKDLSSLPAKSQQLYDKCGSKDKVLAWFEEGNHSHIRVANEQAYDKVVIDFIQERFA